MTRPVLALAGAGRVARAVARVGHHRGVAGAACFLLSPDAAT